MYSRQVLCVACPLHHNGSTANQLLRCFENKSAVAFFFFRFFDQSSGTGKGLWGHTTYPNHYHETNICIPVRIRHIHIDCLQQCVNLCPPTTQRLIHCGTHLATAPSAKRSQDSCRPRSPRCSGRKAAVRLATTEKRCDEPQISPPAGRPL